ncbi:flagellar basal body-associated protein FliL [Pseudomonas marincola]|jgi:flagellar FliL protein|uniref:flagellar basal body-associated protein FliL n=1 Tax=Pseudomonas marincola TaxID=437900 RepID=UPI000B8703CC|nr:flagellar basal body-associated protein FliL [Pseudomonas marincola]
MFKALLFAMLAALVSVQAIAQESAEGEEGKPTVAYVSLVPALVGNFGSGPKLKFYKADVSLRVTGAEAQAKVEHHEPLIRNQLVMLFSQQTEEGLSAPDAKEALRQEALKQVQQVLATEEGEPLVEDLLFNNLILQR